MSSTAYPDDDYEDQGDGSDDVPPTTEPAQPPEPAEPGTGIPDDDDRGVGQFG